MENENKSAEEGIQPSPSSGGAKKKKSKSALGWSIILIIILAVLVLVILDRVVGVNIFTTEENRQAEEVTEFLEETGAWHAVFLTNGQVYFGQMENPEAQFASLKDIYYLQIQQAQQPAPPQPSPDGESQVVPAPQPSPPQLTLIKFGTELHRPTDAMNINRDHILFWEELQSDSQVVQAIANYKASQ